MASVLAASKNERMFYRNFVISQERSETEVLVLTQKRANDTAKV